MEERPILFSGPMVRAILEGRKTQTRRVVKGEFNFFSGESSGNVNLIWERTKNDHIIVCDESKRSDIIKFCPYGKLGDRLYVRETWTTPDNVSDGALYANQSSEFFYRADGHVLDRGGKWRPSIHMPRWASRIDLEITNVRVERLKDIRENDSIAEGGMWTDNGPRDWYIEACKRRGIEPSYKEGNGINGWKECWSHTGESHANKCLSSARMSFANLWNLINGQKGYGWDDNPWVWVVEFKRI